LHYTNVLHNFVIKNWQCVLSDVGISGQWCRMYSWLWVSSFSST